jgi:hypothetical protein
MFHMFHIFHKLYNLHIILPCCRLAKVENKYKRERGQDKEFHSLDITIATEYSSQP